MLKAALSSSVYFSSTVSDPNIEDTALPTLLINDETSPELEGLSYGS